MFSVFRKPCIVGTIYMMFVGLVCISISGQSHADFGDAPAQNPCYQDYGRSCGAMHSMPGRICYSGTNAVPCGDIILIDDSVSDVKIAQSGQQGRQGVSLSCGTASVLVHKFACGTGSQSGICRDQGAKNLTCQGRCASGAQCTGGGIANP